jgi:beta-N-acetylhexosaminidase
MTGTLFVTFALGVLIGFSMGYAFFVSTNRTSNHPKQSAKDQPVQPAGQVTLSPPAPMQESALYAKAGQLDFNQTVQPGRHLFVAVDGASLNPDSAAFLRKLRPGGVLLREANLVDEAQTAQLVREIKQAVSRAAAAWDLPLIAVEPSPGRVDRFSADLPVSAAQLGQEANPDRLRKIGEDFGRACFNRGISVVFAPVLDIYEPGGGLPELERTSFGASQGIVTKMGLALADGVMSAGVIPVVKHYPGMGAARKPPEREIMVIDREVPELAGLMLPFAEAAGRRIPGILVGHVAVPVLERNGSNTPLGASESTPDAGNPGQVKSGPDRPASLSRTLVRRVLRDLWHFEGVVVAADIAEGALMGGRPPEQAVVEALAAGCDAVIYLNPDPQRIHALCLAIENAVSSGRLGLDELNNSAQRLGAWQAWLKDPRGLVETDEQEPAGVSLAESRGADSASQIGSPGKEGNIEQTSGAVRIEHVAQQGDTLESIAESCGVAVEDIRKWNELGDAVLAPGTTLVLWAPAGKSPVAPGPDTAGMSRREHVVQADETLFGIAEEYGVTVLDLLKWNGLMDSNISGGQVLAVYLPVAQEVGGNKSTPPPGVPEPPLEGVETILHEVQRGESLGAIAGKYRTTQRMLLRLNNLSDPNKILIGQKLKVPKP